MIAVSSSLQRLEVPYAEPQRTASSDTMSGVSSGNAVPPQGPKNIKWGRVYDHSGGQKRVIIIQYRGNDRPDVGASMAQNSEGVGSAARVLGVASVWGRAEVWRSGAQSFGTYTGSLMRFGAASAASFCGHGLRGPWLVAEINRKDRRRWRQAASEVEL